MWSNAFWTAYDYVTDTAFQLTSNTFNIVGTCACTIGGMVCTISYTIDKALDAGCFGSINTSGGLSLSVEIRNDYRLEKQSFSSNNRMDWGTTYYLVDYLKPETMFTVGAICISMGTLFQVVSANIELCRQGGKDRRLYKKQDGSLIDSPSWKEYAKVSGGALTKAITQTSLSSATTGGVINILGLQDINKHFTYPSEGTYANGTYYKGPVTSTLFPLMFNMAKNLTFKSQSLDILVEVKGDVQALVNVTYGAGAKIDSRNGTNLAPVISGATIAPITHLISLSLFNSAKNDRDKRIHNASKEIGFQV